MKQFIFLLVLSFFLLKVRGFQFPSVRIPSVFQKVQSKSALNDVVSCTSTEFTGVLGKGHKVTVLGASGGIGQPLSLLLKLNPRVSELKLFDIVRTPGVAADLSHINTISKVKGYVGLDQIDRALKDTEVVLISAGIPRQPGMTRDDLFKTNGNIIAKLAESCAKYCPDAIFLIITNPVNSLVPLFAEVMKKENKYNPKKVLGVTTLDIIRANTFVAEALNIDVQQVKVNVIGGHAGNTILPILSPLSSYLPLKEEEIPKIIKRIQFGGDEVVKAKDGSGSATLSMAYAANYFTSQLLKGMDQENPNRPVIECAFCENDLTAAPYFATPVELGPNGIEKVHSFDKLSPFEQKVFDEMIESLISQEKKGVDHILNPPPDYSFTPPI